MALRIDRNFERAVNYIVARQSELADAVSKQERGRPWLNFSEEPLSSEQQTSTKDEAELHDAFGREEANQDYLEARQNPDAKSREVALAKLAGDFLGACERDSRARRRTRIRMVAHATARAAGHGMDSGPLRRATVDYLERVYLKSREKPAESSGTLV